jgi:hypothetical protein
LRAHSRLDVLPGKLLILLISLASDGSGGPAESIKQHQERSGLCSQNVDKIMTP